MEAIQNAALRERSLLWARTHCDRAKAATDRSRNGFQSLAIIRELGPDSCLKLRAMRQTATSMRWIDAAKVHQLHQDAISVSKQTVACAFRMDRQLVE